MFGEESGEIIFIWRNGYRDLMSIDVVSMCQKRAEMEEPTTYTYISNVGLGSSFNQELKFEGNSLE